VRICHSVLHLRDAFRSGDIWLAHSKRGSLNSSAERYPILCKNLFDLRSL